MSFTINPTDITFTSAVGAGDDTYETNGKLFEIAVVDASLSVLPQFEDSVTATLETVDATSILMAGIEVSQTRGLLQFKTDSSDLNDLSANDLSFSMDISKLTKYLTATVAATAAGVAEVHWLDGTDAAEATATVAGVNVKNNHRSLLFSESEVIENNVNPNSTSSQLIKHDMVRHQAKCITGGYNAADIFGNETAMVEGVKELDYDLQADLAATSSAFTHEITDKVFVAGKNLLARNIGTPDSDAQEDLLEDMLDASKLTLAFAAVGVAGDTSFNLAVASGASGTSAIRVGAHVYGVAIADNTVVESVVGEKVVISKPLIGATAVNDEVEFAKPDGTVTVPLRFQVSDVLSVVVTYNPHDTAHGLGGNAITSRKYRVLIPVVDDT